MAAQSLYQLGLFTYFEINQDYIARVLCINRDKYDPKQSDITLCGGHCYLEKQLKIVDDTSTGKDVPASRLKIEIPVFVVSESETLPLLSAISSTTHFTPYLETAARGMATAVFHPPSKG